MTIRFVLWDNDGVLVDTEEGYYLATRRALGEIGVELDLAHYHRLRAQGVTSWTLAEEAGIDPRTIDRQRSLRNDYYQQFIRSRNLEIEGVHDEIAAMAATYRMAVVTTAKRSDFELIHRERRIVRHMEFVLTGDDYQPHKPDPAGYLAALERFGAAADEAVVIEDSKQGLDAARGAGLACLIVHNPFFGTAHDFDGATRVLGSVGEIRRVLEEMRGNASSD
jgi:HAD superfamily hydrolase (TIGR01509 family)